jgi:hypothetical protein
MTEKPNRVTIKTDDGRTREIDWDPAWDRLAGLPPLPANPANNCVKTNTPNGNVTCLQGGCMAPQSCGLYELDLNNSTSWGEVSYPTPEKPNHVYVCRCR